MKINVNYLFNNTYRPYTQPPVQWE